MILQIWGATAGGAARNSQLASVTGAMAAMGLCATGGGQMGAMARLCTFVIRAAHVVDRQPQYMNIMIIFSGGVANDLLR